jgi:hypothetical protein
MKKKQTIEQRLRNLEIEIEMLKSRQVFVVPQYPQYPPQLPFNIPQGPYCGSGPSINTAQ